ncbi:hypothetical protein WJX77_005206 [Trebouxia sp. C0004]
MGLHCPPPAGDSWQRPQHPAGPAKGTSRPGKDKAGKAGWTSRHCGSTEEAAQPSPCTLQDEAALEEEVPRGQAKHGSPIAPVQQETPDRDTTTMKDEHGMEPELRALQQELQDTKAALHLSKDRLQEQDATIHYLRTDYEASWRKMSGRHEELLQQVKCLNASLRRAGAHDEDAYRHDIQDYKTSP